MTHTLSDTYTAKARTMTGEALDYSLADLDKVLTIWRDKPVTDPAMAKWLAEFDAYAAERQRRARPDYVRNGRARVAAFVRQQRAAGNRDTARIFAAEGNRHYPRKER